MKRLIVCLVAYAAVAFWLFGTGPYRELAAAGLTDTLPESTPFASAAATTDFIAELPTEVRSAYEAFQWRDLLHGPLLAAVLGLLILLAGGGRRWLLVPGALAFADVLENMLLLHAAGGGSAALQPVLTSIKFVALPATLLVLVVLCIRRLAARSRGATPRAGPRSPS